MYFGADRILDGPQSPLLRRLAVRALARAHNHIGVLGKPASRFGVAGIRSSASAARSELQQQQSFEQRFDHVPDVGLFFGHGSSLIRAKLPAIPVPELLRLGLGKTLLAQADALRELEGPGVSLRGYRLVVV